MKTLQRYILRELIFPFLMAITIFTFILIMDKIFALTDLIVKYGVPVGSVCKLLLYILPATFAITIPVSVLVAVIVAFSRLKSDHELTAIRASGISLATLTWVVVVAGTVLTLAMIYFDNSVLPRANYAYKDLYYNIISKRAAIVIREHVFVDDFDGYIFRVGGTEPLSGELRDITVFMLGRTSAEDVRVILAQRGRLITDDVSRRVVLKLEDGYMQVVPRKTPQSFSRLEFNTNLLDLDINHALADQNPENLRSPREMSMGEIRRALREGPPSGEDHNLLRVEFHKKLAIPFACLTFVLIGLPLGVLAPRSGKYLAYFIGVILIFLYYILLSLGETFSVEGRLHPFLSMWLPNLLLSAVGLYGLAWVFAERAPWFSRRRIPAPPGRTAT
jgi:lipopolysaccharide export system permease protein